MSDESGTSRELPPELQPIVTRLEEIQRKCVGLGPRNDEAQEMASRLDGVIEILNRGEQDDGAPPDYGSMAAQLFPVARLFESLGFISVAKEVAHVERSLTQLASEDAGLGSFAAAPSMTARKAPAESDLDTIPEDREHEIEETAGRRGLPKPVGLALLVVLIGILVSIFLVRDQRSDHLAVDDPTTEKSPSAVPVAPVEEPRPTVGPSSPTVDRSEPTPGPRARIADLLAQSRLAYRAGDLDRAISLLSQAALIDKRNTSVLNTAETLVRGLIARADAAADNAEWDVATGYLDRAKELAVRFELSTQPIEFAAAEHRRMVRYTRVDPDEIETIRAAKGRKIIVIVHEGERFEGRIHDVSNGVLEIHEGMQVGQGGTLYHVDEIPLSLIREIRIYPE